jgi:hypothetical protein
VFEPSDEEIVDDGPVVVIVVTAFVGSGPEVDGYEGPS